MFFQNLYWLSKKNPIVYWIQICWLVFLAGCGVTPEHSKYIPKDASFVVMLDLANITPKTPNLPALFNREILSLVDLHNSAKALFFFNQIKNSGISLNNKVYIYGNSNPSAAQNYWAIAFRLDDERAFDAYLRKLPEPALRIKSFSGMRYVLLEKGTILGWVNKVAILVGKSEKATEEELKDRLQKLRDLPEKESVKENNEQFRKLQTNHFDMAVWVNLPSFDYKLKELVKYFPFMNVNLEGNYLTAISKFEQGDIFTDVKFHNLTASLRQYKNLVKKGIAPQLLHQVPLHKPMAILGVGLDTKEIKKIYKGSSSEFFLNTFFQIEKITGASTDSLFDMLSGDVLWVLNDIKTNEYKGKAIYDYVVGLGIQSEAIMQKILKKLVQDKMLVPSQNYFFVPRFETYLIPRSQILFIATSSALKDELLGQDEKALNHPVLSQLGAKSFLIGYGDLHKDTRKKIPKNWFNDIKNEFMFKNIGTNFESISFQTVPMKDIVAETKINITFTNKQQNALISLSQLFQ